MDFNEYDKLNGKSNVIYPEIKSNKRFKLFIYILIIFIILLFIILLLFFRINTNLYNSENKNIDNGNLLNFENDKKEINEIDNNNGNNKIQNLIADEKAENINNNELEQNEKKNLVEIKKIKRNYIKSVIYNRENEDSFFKYRKEILIKNNNFEKNNITTQLVKNRIEELNSTVNLKEENNTIINNLNLENLLNDNVTNSDLLEQIKYLSSKKNGENYLKYFQYMENPKISVIIPVYNSQIFLGRVYKSIQEQSFKDIEIIFVDDCSKDNSVSIINKFQKRDRRVVLLKNKVNRGPFYSRNKGALFARGEFIQFIDSDDIFLNDIFEKAYYTAKIKNIDIVQYKLLKNSGFHFFPLVEKNKDSIIYQPKLSEEMFYGSGTLKQVNYYIYNKIIKRDAFLKSLIYIGDEILKENLYIHEDLLQLFCLLRVANSLMYLDNVGYAKLKNRERPSLQDSIKNPIHANQIFHDISLELKLIFNKTDLRRKDKKICYAFYIMVKKYYSNLIEHVTKGFELIDESFNLLINSIYFRKDIRISFKRFKDKIMNNQNNFIK